MDQTWTCHSSVHLQPRRPSLSWAASRGTANRLREVISALYPALERLHLDCHIQLCSPQNQKGVDLLEQVQSKPQRRLEHLQCRQAESWGCSAWRRLWVDLAPPSSIQRELEKNMERNLLYRPVVIGQGGTALNWRQVDIRQKFFTQKLARHQKSLPILPGLEHFQGWGSGQPGLMGGIPAHCRDDL